MKLLLIITVALCLYILSVTMLVAENHAQPDEEARAACKTGPIVCAVTIFFALTILTTVRLAMQGVLPLL